MMRNLENELCYFIIDNYGDKRSNIDFSALGLNEVISKTIRAAFISCCTHNSVETQRQSWRSIRKFSLFLISKNYQNNTSFNKNILTEFLDWLNHENLNVNTRASIFNLIKALILWCERNHPSLITGHLTHPNRILRRPRKAPKQSISTESLKTILNICYREIEAVDNRISTNLELLEKNKLGLFESEKFTLLNELLTLGSGRIPTQKVLYRSKNCFARRITTHGGLRHLTSMIFITPRDLFPFYIAILAQTAGNPMAILEMSRDCIKPHPLRDDRTSVYWYKKRASAEQKADFNVTKKFSAPNIIKRLLFLSYNLIPLANNRHKNSLFVAFNKSGAFVPCVQLMHIILQKFIKLYALDKFDFKSFRNISASLHYKESKDLLVSRNKLNHKSIRSTIEYIEPELFFEENNELIADAQNAIINLSFKKNTTNPIAQPEHARVRTSTIFGFDCKDPYQGIAPGSSQGKLCLNFFHCATCPGSIVMLDDPFVVARLKQAEEVLLSAEKRSLEEGWGERFESLYLPALKIIQEDLLAKVSAHILEQAVTIHIPPLPRLE